MKGGDNVSFFSSFFAFLSSLFLSPCMTLAATYTPLITETTFDGVQSDVSATAVAIISILLIIIGVAMIARAMTH
jgi:hypothetical protein